MANSDSKSETLRVEFSFLEAGCMIWAGNLDMYERFCDAWDRLSNHDPLIKGQGELSELIYEHHAAMPLDLYQDDGFLTRVVLDELNQREQEDWTACAQWQLDLPTGKLLVSGIVDEDEEVPALEEADLEALLQCYVEVPPGSYAITIYAYPPGDLSTGWGQISEPGLFKPTTGIEPENPLAYFQRTRPGEAIPAWLGEDYAETEEEQKQFAQTLRAGTRYVNFVVHLVPLSQASSDWQPDTEHAPRWKFRKPERCPLGVLALPQNNEDDEE
jgi:hypothetical protein